MRVGGGTGTGHSHEAQDPRDGSLCEPVGPLHAGLRPARPAPPSSSPALGIYLLPSPSVTCSPSRTGAPGRPPETGSSYSWQRTAPAHPGACLPARICSLLFLPSGTLGNSGLYVHRSRDIKEGDCFVILYQRERVLFQVVTSLDGDGLIPAQPPHQWPAEPGWSKAPPTPRHPHQRVLADSEGPSPGCVMWGGPIVPGRGHPVSGVLR